MSDTIIDQNYLKESQYKTSNNLQARGNLHQLYSMSEIGWFQWVFDQLDLQPNERVLACGAGPAWVWQKNLHRLPSGLKVTLTDLSDGMVAEAETNVAESGEHFVARSADITTLPFPDNSFDKVTANHMLYHVPDIPAALAEVKRVLRPGGTLFAATNGLDHMRELKTMRTLLLPTIKSLWGDLSFRLENGREWLQPHFDAVELRHFDDALHVTEFEPLLAYALSADPLRQAVTPETIAQAKAAFDQTVAEHGYFHITKSTCMFVAH